MAERSRVSSSTAAVMASGGSAGFNRSNAARAGTLNLRQLGHISTFNNWRHLFEPFLFDLALLQSLLNSSDGKWYRAVVGHPRCTLQLLGFHAPTRPPRESAKSRPLSPCRSRTRPNSPCDLVPISIVEC